MQWFDKYHEEERALRPLIAAALKCADDAASELDDSTYAPLERPTIKVKRCLRDLDRLIPSPRHHGDHPPLEITQQLNEQREKLSVWLDDLDLLIEAGPRGSEAQPQAVKVSALAQQGPAEVQRDASSDAATDANFVLHLGTHPRAVLDGKDHELTVEHARILERLASANGALVSPDDLRNGASSANALTKAIGRMPAPIQALIAGKTGQQGGRRLRRIPRLERPR